MAFARAHAGLFGALEAREPFGDTGRKRRFLQLECSLNAITEYSCQFKPEFPFHISEPLVLLLPEISQF